MTFNSYIFILLFLPLVLIAYYLVGKIRNGKYANYVLIAASLVFFAYASLYAALAMIGSTIANYFLSKRVINSAGKNRKTWFTIGILLNVVSLVFLKYNTLIFEKMGGI